MQLRVDRLTTCMFSIVARLFEEVIWVHHRFEFQVVVGRVLEKHGFLCTSLALKSQMWLDDEFDTRLLEFLGQSIEFVVGQAGAEVCNWNLVTVNWVEVICALVLLTNPVAHELVAEEIIVLPLGR